MVGRRVGHRPLVAEQQSGRSELGGDEFLEPNGGGGLTPGELGHEGDARLFHAAFDGLGLVGVEFQGDGAIDGFAGLAGGENGHRPEPLGGKHKHHVDIFPLDQDVVAVHCLGVEVGRRLFRPMAHGVTDRPDLEAIGQRPQGRGVPHLPNVPQADQANTKSHGEQSSGLSLNMQLYRLYRLLHGPEWFRKGVRKKYPDFVVGKFPQPPLVSSCSPDTLRESPARESSYNLPQKNGPAFPPRSFPIFQNKGGSP